jgi:hypothetical protein
MARIAFNKNEQEKAIEMTEKLAMNIRKRIIDPVDKARSLTFVLSQLAHYYGKTGKRNEQLDVCDEGISAGVEYQMTNHVPYLLFCKVYALDALGGDRTEIIRLLYQAYFGAELQQNTVLSNNIKKFALSLFNVDIRMYE